MELTLDETRAICVQLDEASALCDRSLQVLKAHEGLGIIQAYLPLVGAFLGHSYTNILAPIWRQFPELEPEEMKKPYKEPVAFLSPESKAAISAFAVVAGPALARVEAVLESEGRSFALPFGGLAEVKKSVAEIEGFLATPRFHKPIVGGEHES